MDSTIALAIMEKARRVFERPGTFLSFPLSPVAYKPDDLRQVNSGGLTNQAVLALSEFSRLVNSIPDGTLWSADSGRYLWDVYEGVLKTARVASSTRTAQEEADYQKALKYLTVTRTDGTLDESPQVKAYNQYRDAWFNANETYNEQKITADLSTDPAVKREWQEVKEPRLRDGLNQVEHKWELLGYKAQVEDALRVQDSLGAKSPSLTWGRWAESFDPSIDLPTDTNKQTFAPTGFSPTDVLDVDGWNKFTLRGNEAKALIAASSAELKAHMAPDAVDLEIDSLSFEFTSVGLTRPWLIPAVFAARFWKFSDGSMMLSDGKEPPSGICPGYVSALVFARKLVINLAASSPKNDKLIEYFRKRSDLSLGMFHIAMPPTATPPQGAPHAGPPVMVTVAPTLSAVKNPATTAAASTMRIAPATTAAVSTMRIAPATAQLLRVAPGVSAGPATPSSKAMVRLNAALFTRVPIDINVLGGGAGPSPPGTGPKPTPTPTPAPVSNEIYIMAYICKKLPKCPDPDPAIAW